MTPLFGHEAAVAAFREALASGRIHHAWLIAGSPGIGKALFADKAALRFLAEGQSGPLDDPGLDVPDEHPAARLAAAGSHPDLMRLERLPKESGTDLARNITIEQVRGLQRLFGTKPTFSQRRAVVVDSIDDLERGAANALLKNLEEPPAGSIFLLVSRAPERLLPTIRSRCRLLRLSPLRSDAMTSALRASLPDAEDKEIAALAGLGEGAPGHAIAFRGLDIAELDREIGALIAQGDPANARRSKLASSLSPKAAQPRYEAFLARAPSFVAAAARERRGPALAEALRLWEKAQGLAGIALRQSLDPQSTVFEMAGYLAALAPKDGRRSA